MAVTSARRSASSSWTLIVMVMCSYGPNRTSTRSGWPQRWGCSCVSHSRLILMSSRGIGERLHYLRLPSLAWQADAAFLSQRSQLRHCEARQVVGRLYGTLRRSCGLVEHFPEFRVALHNLSWHHHHVTCSRATPFPSAKTLDTLSFHVPPRDRTVTVTSHAHDLLPFFGFAAALAGAGSVTRSTVPSLTASQPLRSASAGMSCTRPVRT